jgi:ketosteroid isomerase-like protein
LGRRASADTHGKTFGRRPRNVCPRFWDLAQIEPHEFIEADNHVVIPLTLHALGRDGIEVRARTTWTFTIRDGAIERLCMYQERQEALEAPRLSE